MVGFDVATVAVKGVGLLAIVFVVFFFIIVGFTGVVIILFQRRDLLRFLIHSIFMLHIVSVVLHHSSSLNMFDAVDVEFDVRRLVTRDRTQK
jgi:hypothetical protein